jgi:hypothetical protein
MKVRCTANNLAELSPEVQDRLRRTIHREGPDGDLCLGGMYEVIALQEFDGGLWLILDNIPQSDHPYNFPIEMFAIVDSVVRNGWSVGFEQHGRATIFKYGFSEWVQDSSLFERLLDGDPDAVAVFQRLRSRLSQEQA